MLPVGRRLPWRRVLCLLVAVLVPTSGCSAARDPVLEQLVRDPVAARSQADAFLVSGTDIAASTGDGIFGKPRRTQVIRTFRPVGISSADLLRRSREQAVSAGWRMSGNTGDISGSKDFAFGIATVSIYRNAFVDNDQIVIVLQPGPMP